MKHRLSAKNVFIVDGLGATLTALLLLTIVAGLQPYFGLPLPTVYFLSSLALLFAVYDFLCFRLAGKKWPLFLGIIIVANGLYCFLTLGLLLFYRNLISPWAVAYFSGEILVVLVLVRAEWRLLRQREAPLVQK